jgi:hypothetical protein
MARAAIADGVRDRWTYVGGSSRRRLPGLLRAVGPIDVFLHDSHHTGRTMRFELGAAWPALRPGGVLLCDDVQDNAAFAELARDLPPGHAAVGQEERKATLFGIAVKPSRR